MTNELESSDPGDIGVAIEAGSSLLHYRLIEKIGEARE